MDNWIFFQAYILGILVCLTLTLALIWFINKGLKRFFENLCQNEDIAKFFIRLTKIVLFLGGLSAGLENSYNTTEKANWLTVTWDSIDQVKESMYLLLILLTIFAVVFFILNLIDRKTND